MNAARPAPLSTRIMDYVTKHEGCSIADICIAVVRGNSIKPTENAIARLWLAKRIAVRNNVVTLT